MQLLRRWNGTQRRISLVNISNEQEGEICCGLYVLVHPDLYRRQFFICGNHDLVNDCYPSFSVKSQSQVRSEEIN